MKSVGRANFVGFGVATGRERFVAVWARTTGGKSGGGCCGKVDMGRRRRDVRWQADRGGGGCNRCGKET